MCGFCEEFYFLPKSHKYSSKGSKVISPCADNCSRSENLQTAAGAAQMDAQQMDSVYAIKLFYWASEISF